MNDPRPAISSTRPCEIRSMVANCWKTRTGSSVLSTVTALDRPIGRGLAGGRGQHGRGRGHRIVGPVVLADAEEVEADLFGQPDPFQQVEHPLAG